jgi:TPR repeat protein
MSVYEQGINELLNKNYSKAIELFEKAKYDYETENNKETDSPYLAFMNFYGVGLPVDYKSAWENCYYEADVGTWIISTQKFIGKNWLSRFIVAKMQYNGIYLEQNIDEALLLFKRISDMYKIETELNNDPIFKILIEEYNDVDAQYIRGLLLYHKGKYFDSKYLAEGKEIMQKIVDSDNHDGARRILQEIEKVENSKES